MNINSEILKTIQYGISQSLRNLRTDVTFPTVVYEVNDNGTYTIRKDGQDYRIPNATNSDIALGQRVWVKIPMGKLERMHICGISGGPSGTGGISFFVGEDGLPYARYKAGADTVTKKLGSTLISLGTGTSFNVAGVYSDYKALTAGHFITEAAAGSASGGAYVITDGLSYRNVTSWNTVKSYNPTAGILTAYINVVGDIAHDGWSGRCYSVNKPVRAYLVI